ncbi:hypothetical protein FIBSPDRAFT_912394 [Athelia psychrophila]|uniref:Integrase core domain-containing protein n=1 Tax=Athelia psychrophila TaxID=1759441 RepID=A0A166EI07_9AGAM|nr:hypothetical protein FIBSPDRAFT_912394 [Fibularhizoctonia sp. CBS 109695]
MEDNRGHARGSYIWGRSVHNTRIERLWYDITSGYGQKWKNLFLELETHHGLYPRLTEHIWLLHHLFLAAIDRDAQEWLQVWNHHTMRNKGQRGRSPIDMFTFSLLQDGPRGLTGLLEPPDEPVENPDEYGIDWDVASDERLMDHLHEHNPQDTQDTNPFSNAPATAAHVECQPPNCPFAEDEVRWLDDTLRSRVDIASRVMQTRRLVWVEALALCQQLYDRVA